LERLEALDAVYRYSFSFVVVRVYAG
jgi:hypothetical protein